MNSNKSVDLKWTDLTLCQQIVGVYLNILWGWRLKGI